MATTQDGFAHVRQLMDIMRGDAKHAEAAGSTADALWVLYDRILRLSPEAAEDRDRLYLSKGHGPMAYYAILAAKGFLDPVDLFQFGTFHSPLGHHPDRQKIPAVEISSGSLGHGLPLGVGSALGLRALGRTGVSSMRDPTQRPSPTPGAPASTASTLSSSIITRPPRAGLGA
jgi:transketolase